MKAKGIQLRWSLITLILFVVIALIGLIFSIDGSSIDSNNYLTPPFQDWGQSILGTDALGRNVLSGIIRGASIALQLGILTIGLVLLIAIPIGVLSGFYGNKYMLGFPELVLNFLSFFFLSYNLCYFGFNGLSLLLLLLAFYSMVFLPIHFDLIAKNRWKLKVPIDNILMKIAEVFKSIPSLILLIIILSFWSKTGIFSIAVSLSILLWVRIARFIRGEILAIKETEFIQSQISLGSSDAHIIFKHCLPRAMKPVWIYLVFLFGAIILLEATLSFIGLGLPIDQISWGSMLNESRKYIEAWWIALFPGMVLFFLMFALNKESEAWKNWRNSE